MLCSLILSGCNKSEAEERQDEHTNTHKIEVTTPLEKEVITTQQYVCQIHSRRHIEVCALEGGYLEEIPVKEGQAVKEGDLLFKIFPHALSGQVGLGGGRSPTGANRVR